MTDSPTTLLTLQLVASALLVVAVLWFMWRLPKKEPLAYTEWAPWLAFGSAWAGLIAASIAGLLWLLPYADRWLPVVLLVLCPTAVATGSLVLWIYRGQPEGSHAVSQQKNQARVGLTLAFIAVAITYTFVLTHKNIFTPVGS
jgi:hypothetical protein